MLRARTIPPPKCTTRVLRGCKRALISEHARTEAGSCCGRRNSHQAASRSAHGIKTYGHQLKGAHK